MKTCRWFAASLAEIVETDRTRFHLKLNFSAGWNNLPSSKTFFSKILWSLSARLSLKSASLVAFSTEILALDLSLTYQEIANSAFRHQGIWYPRKDGLSSPASFVPILWRPQKTNLAPISFFFTNLYKKEWLFWRRPSHAQPIGQSAEQNLGFQLYSMRANKPFFPSSQNLVPGAIQAIKASLRLVLNLASCLPTTLSLLVSAQFCICIVSNVQLLDVNPFSSL